MRPLLVALLVIAAGSAFAAPKAVLSSHSIDLGVIQQKQVVDVPLVLKNAGDVPLTIQKIQFSCHCVSARELTEAEKVIAPGAEFALPITYDPMNYTGNREALIAISTDDPETPFLEVRVTTTIVAPVVVVPRVLRWGPTNKGARFDAEIRLKPAIAGTPLELLAVDVPHPDIVFDHTATMDSGDIVLQSQFTLASTARIGELNTIVEAQVQLEDRQFPVRLPLSLYVMGDATVRPPQIVSINRPIAPGERISTIALIWTRPEKPVEIIEAAAYGPVRTVVRAMPDRFEVDVLVEDNAPSGPQAAQVELFTTSADEPVSTVPVYFLAGAPAFADPPSILIEVGERQSNAAEFHVRSMGMGSAVTNVHTELEGVTISATDPVTGRVELRAAATSALPRSGHIVVELTNQPPLHVPIVIRSATTNVEGAP